METESCEELNHMPEKSLDPSEIRTQAECSGSKEQGYRQLSNVCGKERKIERTGRKGDRVIDIVGKCRRREGGKEMDRD